MLANIPLDMFQYKFLMNPIRLAILKMLYIYDKLTSIQIKSNLEISWSEYYTHVRALEGKSYITIQDEFDENGKRQFVYLETQGRQDYENLINLLEDFVKVPLSIKIDKIQDKDDEQLYPNNA